ncbi:MAG TPA: DegT/DnrJ/EryC1/StrS family aminotransferase [Desulfobacterales bacterium]|jgi:perosamine synthetase|nr:DegT/DnrJ/EryC1/StrS family aminotransferase [Desulfobacterales bacterium]
MIRLTIPSIDEEDLRAVREVLASGHLVQGSQVAAFEALVAERAGTGFAVAVSNCTAALHLSLLALGVQAGDLVIVTAYSWVATANVIELCGAHPVFVDIRPDTFNMDPSVLESVLKRLMGNRETARRVKAILPVHAFGLMAGMTEIMDLADRYGIPVVEDGACALGASLEGRPAGSWGRLGCFSFHPRKAVTTGEGGMIAGNDGELIRRLKALRNHGQDPHSPSPDFILPGFNYRMTEFQAALGITQMKKLDHIISSRKKLAQDYEEFLRETSLTLPVVPPGHSPVFQSYVVLLPKEDSAFRNDLIARLKEGGVEAAIGTWNMPMTSFFRARYGFKKGDFPVADHVFARSLTLPLYAHMTRSDQEKVTGELKKSLAERKR